MARTCGLDLAVALGDYDGSPFEAAHSPRWLALFRKKSMAEG